MGNFAENLNLGNGFQPPLQTPSTNLHPWLSKQMPSVSEDVGAEAF